MIQFDMIQFDMIQFDLIQFDLIQFDLTQLILIYIEDTIKGTCGRIHNVIPFESCNCSLGFNMVQHHDDGDDDGDDGHDSD